MSTLRPLGMRMERVCTEPLPGIIKKHGGTPVLPLGDSWIVQGGDQEAILKEASKIAKVEAKSLPTDWEFERLLCSYLLRGRLHTIWFRGKVRTLVRTPSFS